MLPKIPFIAASVGLECCNLTPGSIQLPVLELKLILPPAGGTACSVMLDSLALPLFCCSVAALTWTARSLAHHPLLRHLLLALH